MILLVVGGLLILAGIGFGIWRAKDEQTGFQVFKINITGQSWLILVVMGLGCIVGWWWFDNEHVNHIDKEPPTEVDVTLALAEESFDEPYTFGDDGDFDALWLSCDAGAMQACDDLYQDSPVGSEYELFGATCGARFDDPPEFCVDAPIDESTVETFP